MKNYKKSKRKVDLVVISDVHLGTYGCRAEELCQYLKSIKPKKVILNGDILDIWQFKKSYWPQSHMKVLKIIINWIYKGVDVTYITGNHDELLRKFTDFKMGSFSLKNKEIINLNGETAWIFHGDVFDVSMQHSRWLVKLGSIAYDFLIRLNGLINFIYLNLGKEKISISKRIKNKVKGAVKYINKFEQIASDIAIDNNYNYVVCGHIHHPEIKKLSNEKGCCVYLNSGDWVENMTSLEYNKGKWSIYQYDSSHYHYNPFHLEEIEEETKIVEKSSQEIFNEMLKDFNLMQQK